MTASSTSTRLHVLKAVEDGWNAFTKAPWPFILFTLLYGFLAFILQFILNLTLQGGSKGSIGAGGIILYIIFFIVSLIINFWGVTGLIRGSWMALDGQRPSFSQFTRWDGSSISRLFTRWIALAILFIVIGLLTWVVGFGLGQISQALWIIPGIIAFVIFAYLAVNQKFWMFIALLENRAPFENIQRGRDVVDPSWWWVVLLLIVEGLILAIGTLLCGVGLLVAGPVVSCIATAAYRQLFGSEDQTGLLTGE